MLNNSKGFTLIELMVAVSILLILAAISAPQYQKYKLKASQNDAKNQLISIYTAEQIFKANNRTFFMNLWAIGFEPNGIVNYRASFNISGSTSNPVEGYTSGVYSPTAFFDTSLICGSSLSGGISSQCVAAAASEGTPSYSQIGSVRNGFQVTPSTFIIGTARVLQGAGTSTTSDDRVDVWTMNHRKELVNVINGAL